MKIVIDRFESDYAIIEMQNGERLSVPKKLFDGAKEGDTVEITVIGKEKKQSTHSLFENLRKKSEKTDK